MEKFSKWRDLGTGIAPFVKKQPVQTPFEKVIIYLLKPLLFIIKSPLILLFFSWILLIDFLSHLLLTGYQQKLFKLFLGQKIFARLLLFLLGFLFVQLSPVSLSKGKRREDKLSKLGINDFIFVNHQSWVDLLWAESLWLPAYYLLPNEREISVLSFYQLFFHLLGFKIKKKSVKDFSLLKEGLKVCFPESETTNGKSVLSLEKFSCFQKSFQTLRHPIHFFTFQYHSNEYTPSAIFIGYENFFWHLVQLAGSFSQEMKILKLIEADLEGIKESEMFEIQKILSQMLKVKSVGLSALDKPGFLAYHKKTK